jgi:hypothetical protein
VSDQPHSWTGWKRRPFRPVTPARAFVFLAVLALLLAAGSYWLSVRAVRGEVANRATVVQLCETGNGFRAQQVTLWTHLIATSQPPPHETAAQRRQRQELIAGLLAYVRKVFAPRDCAARFNG